MNDEEELPVPTLPDMFPMETDVSSCFAGDTITAVMAEFDGQASQGATQAIAVSSSDAVTTTSNSGNALMGDSLTAATRMMDSTGLKKEKSNNNNNNNNKTKVTDKKSQSSAGKQKKKNANLKDCPKRALSAYNFFFAAERKKMLVETPVRAIGKPRKSHGKVGFSEMVQRIATKWKNIDPQDKLYYEGLAAKDKWRYNVEMGEWTVDRQAKRAQEAAAQQQQQQQQVRAGAACDASQPVVHDTPQDGYMSTLRGNADNHQEQQQPMCLFNYNTATSVSAFDDDAYDVPTMSTSSTSINSNMVLPGVTPTTMSMPGMIVSSQQQQHQQLLSQQRGGGGGEGNPRLTLPPNEAQARDFLRRLQQDPASRHYPLVMFPAAAETAVATTTLPSCSSTSTMNTMYNLSSNSNRNGSFSSSGNNVNNNNVHMTSLMSATFLLDNSPQLHHHHHAANEHGATTSMTSSSASTYDCNSNNIHHHHDHHNNNNNNREDLERLARSMHRDCLNLFVNMFSTTGSNNSPRGRRHAHVDADHGTTSTSSSSFFQNPQ